MCSFPIIVHRHLERAESQFSLHHIPFKTQQLKEQWHSLDHLLRELRLDRIDELATDLLTNTEKNVLNSERVK